MEEIIPPSESAGDALEHPLDPRYVQLQREVGWITTAVMSVGLAIGLLILLTPRRWVWWLILWFIGTCALAWLSQRWPAIAYRHWSYRIDHEGIQIRRGVYWRGVINVPRSRVQHTDVVQGPLERRHGLGRVLIHTAGTEHSRVELPGLEYHVALGIRDSLLPREGSDAV